MQSIAIWQLGRSAFYGIKEWL